MLGLVTVSLAVREDYLLMIEDYNGGSGVVELILIKSNKL